MGYRFSRILLAVGLLGVFSLCWSTVQADPLPWVSLDLLARPTSGQFDPELSGVEWQWLRSKRVLVVGVTEPDYPPFDVTSSGNDLEGITADYLGILGASLELQIQVRRYPDRATAIEALRKGEIDLLSRATNYESEFPDVVLSSPYFANQPVIVGMKGVRPNTHDRLSGKRIAVVGDYFSSREIRRYFPDAHVVYFDSLRQALEEVSFGRADFYVGDVFSSQYLLGQGYLPNLKLLNFVKFNEAGFSFAVNASQQMLLGIINKALAGIPVQARVAIQQRWRAGSGFSISDEQLVLTAQEQRWLNLHPRPVLQVDPSLAPLTFFDSQQQFRGIVADVLDLVAEKTGLNFEVQPATSIPEMLQRVRDGRADAIAALTPTPERGELLDFTRPYLSTSFVIVTRKGNEEIADIADLRSKHVAVPRGTVLIPYLREHCPGIQLVVVENSKDALALVNDGKADAAVHLLVSANFLIPHQYRNLHVVAALGSNVGNFSFAVTQADPELLSILNKALLAISPDDMANIIGRWSNNPDSSGSVWDDYRRQIFQAFIGGALLFLLVLIWNWSLQQKVRRRSQAERDLHGRLEFKRALVDGIPHPVVIRDRKGRLLTCNRSYLEFTGLSREEAHGTCLNEVHWLEPQQAEELHNEHLQTMELGQPRAFDRVLVIHGEARQVHHWTTPYRGSNGEVLGLVSGWIDVTERERLHHQLQVAKEQAEEASRTKSTFLATMSHEIRTPMNAVIGMLELALKNGDCGGCRDQETIEVAYDSAKSLLLLIGDILDVAKIESGRLSLMPERAKLRELVESVARVFDGLARQKGLQLQLEIDAAAACDVLIDPLRFKQILSNLVSNAIKFTDKGFVRIDVAGDLLADDRLALSLCVEDSGIGISEDDQAKLFEPFSQVEQVSRASRGGTGLGLTICRKLAEMMGGMVRLESKPGVGTRVYVQLVLPTLEPLPEPVLQNEPQQSTAGSSLRVLIVDDHPANRMLLSQQLEHLGHQVVIAEDGMDALQVWHPGDFDLVITDCNMPVLSGYGLAGRIREIERDMDVRPCMIFGFTANAQPDEVVRCRNAGMDDCLFKPIGLDNLRGRLEQVPRSTSEAATIPCVEIEDGFDIQTLEEMTGGNPALIRSLLNELHGSNQADAGRLEALLGDGDLKQLAELAHRIKGAARLVRADVLRDCCEALEQACRQDVEQADLAQHVQFVLQAMGDLQAQLQNRIKAMADSANADSMDSGGRHRHRSCREKGFVA